MKELQVLTNALDAAIKQGVFNLQEAGNILQCINAVGQKLQSVERAATDPLIFKDPIAKEEPTED